MKKTSFGNIHDLFIEITKIAASFSIVCTASGFFYLLVYLVVLTGGTVLFPISIQDIFISSRRWGLLFILYILIVWYKENGTFNNLIYRCHYSNNFHISAFPSCFMPPLFRMPAEPNKPAF